MFKNKFNKKSLLVLIVLTVYLLVFPVVGIVLSGGTTNNYNSVGIKSVNNLTVQTPDQSENNQLMVSDGLNYNLFDPELNSYLGNLSVSNDLQTQVNVIVMFKEGISQSERINILNSIFDNYDLK
ncbi:MAG: hypothetical protein P8Y97_23995, partial [Candidatus Lokiarchaeota archaeon]